MGTDDSNDDNNNDDDDGDEDDDEGGNIDDGKEYEYCLNTLPFPPKAFQKESSNSARMVEQMPKFAQEIHFEFFL